MPDVPVTVGRGNGIVGGVEGGGPGRYRILLHERDRAAQVGGRECINIVSRKKVVDEIQQIRGVRQPVRTPPEQR